MDEFDRAAMDKLADEEKLWKRDTIYPGSQVLTHKGISKRDRLAAELRRTAAYSATGLYLH